MNSPAAESPEQLQFSPAQIEKAQALLDDFRVKEPDYEFLELLTRYPDADYVLAEKICQLFKFEFVLYQPVTGLHGVTEGSCVLLAGYEIGENDRRPIWTAGHEVSHMFARRKVAEHAQLLAYIMRECVTDTAFYERSQREKLARGLLRPFREDPVPEGWDALVNEEVVADISGNLWQDPIFWADLYERDANTSNRSVYTEVIARLNEARPEPYRPWARDVAKARDRLVEYTLGFID
ncbi:hypothetical protein IFT43_02065 [Oxalobacteraceae sp. CFBP 13708]|nr:hypothetical protein [Oxalobacteraceae sp. CFBP 13708]